MFGMLKSAHPHHPLFSIQLLFKTFKTLFQVSQSYRKRPSPTVRQDVATPIEKGAGFLHFVVASMETDEEHKLMIHPHLVQPVEKWGGGSAGCGGLDKPSRSTIDMRLMAQYHLKPFPHCQRQALVK